MNIVVIGKHLNTVGIGIVQKQKWNKIVKVAQF